MPKYTFKCTTCEFQGQKIVERKTKTISCPECGADANRQMPQLSGPPEVREKVGEFGKTQKKDQEKMLKDRQADYYWKHEVPKFVASGIYTLETMLENQWVYYDDNGKLHTRTRPPSKG